MELKQRLSKYLAAVGIASRRKCEELIFDGQVQVNGATILVPQTLVGPQDQIKVNQQPISSPPGKVYYILNKPKGYVCSTVGRKQVLDLFSEKDERLFTIGRLDKDTYGLLLVTNDGHFAHRVIHPSSGIHKEYLAKTDEEIMPEHLQMISQGALVDGVLVKPIRVTKVRRGTLKVTLAEGKKHEVRILLKAAGLEVLELSRIRIGGLHLGTLPVGQWRTLTEREKTLIFE